MPPPPPEHNDTITLAFLLELIVALVRDGSINPAPVQEATRAMGFRYGTTGSLGGLEHICRSVQDDTIMAQRSA